MRRYCSPPRARSGTQIIRWSTWVNMVLSYRGDERLVMSLPRSPRATTPEAAAETDLRRGDEPVPGRERQRSRERSAAGRRLGELRPDFVAHRGKHQRQQREGQRDE